MASETASQFIGAHVLVRTYSAGVHLGTLVEKEGRNVVLKDARRILSWSGAFTLSEASQAGVEKGSRISVAVPMIELTQAIEIIPTSDTARATYDSIHE